jgi:hypothetical protein
MPKKAIKSQSITKVTAKEQLNSLDASDEV